MEIEELSELYKKDKLFTDFNVSAFSEIEDFSTLLEKYKYGDDKILYSHLIDAARNKVCETAWLYFIHQCKKIIDGSENKEIVIINKSYKYMDCIAYIIEEGKNNHIIAFPDLLINLNMSIQSKEIKASTFLKDIENIMVTIHRDVIRNRIENFTKFNSYCEKINLEKSLSKNINIENESLIKKRL